MLVTFIGLRYQRASRQPAMTLVSMRKASVSKDYSNDPVLKDMLRIPCIFCSEYKTPIIFDLDLHLWESHRKDLYNKLKSFPEDRESTLNNRINYAIELGRKRALEKHQQEKIGKIIPKSDKPEEVSTKALAAKNVKRNSYFSQEAQKEMKTLDKLADRLPEPSKSEPQLQPEQQLQEQINRRVKMSKGIEYRCLYCNDFVSYIENENGKGKEDNTEYPKHVFSKHKGYLPYPSESDLLKNGGKLLKRIK